MRLKEKGFDKKTIDAVIAQSNFQEQIRQVQSGAYTNAFLDALSRGDLVSSGAALGQLAQYNPQAAAMYVSYYPSFKDNWGEGVKRSNAELARKYQLEDMKQKRQWSREDSDRAFAQKSQMMDRQHGYDLSKISANAQAQYNAKMAQAEYNIGMLMASGMPREQAIQTVLGGGVNGNRSSGATKSNLTQSEKENAQSVANLVNRATKAVRSTNDDNAGDRQAVDEAWQTTKDLYSKGKIDEETYNQALSALYKLNLDMQYKYYGNTNVDFSSKNETD